MRLDKALHLLFYVILGFSINAQDLHYSQFFASPLNINPGMTGIFNGDVRLTGIYRNQWPTVPVDYTTFTGSADLKFLRPNSSNFWSGGLVFNYDQAGDSKLRFGQLGLGGSYTIQANTQNFVSFGAMLSFAQRSFSLTNLTFDNQYDGGQFDPTRGSNESFDNTSKFAVDISLGGNWRWQKTSRTKLDVGIGVFHLNQPNNPYYDDDDIKLPIRLGIHGIGSFQLIDQLDLLLRGLYQNQGPHSETALGLGGLLHISRKKGKEFGLELGVNWRLKDAYVPMIRLHLNNLQAGFSYDINTSPFKVATGNKGGPEFSLIYIITKVKPLNNYKVCPIF